MLCRELDTRFQLTSFSSLNITVNSRIFTEHELRSFSSVCPLIIRQHVVSVICSTSEMMRVCSLQAAEVHSAQTLVHGPLWVETMIKCTEIISQAPSGRGHGNSHGQENDTIADVEEHLPRAQTGPPWSPHHSQPHSFQDHLRLAPRCAASS